MDVQEDILDHHVDDREDQEDPRQFRFVVLAQTIHDDTQDQHELNLLHREHHRQGIHLTRVVSLESLTTEIDADDRDHQDHAIDDNRRTHLRRKKFIDVLDGFHSMVMD